MVPNLTIIVSTYCCVRLIEMMGSEAVKKLRVSWCLVCVVAIGVIAFMCLDTVRRGAPEPFSDPPRGRAARSARTNLAEDLFKEVNGVFGESQESRHETAAPSALDVPATVSGQAKGQAVDVPAVAYKDISAQEASDAQTLYGAPGGLYYLIDSRQVRSAKCFLVKNDSPVPRTLIAADFVLTDKDGAQYLPSRMEADGPKGSVSVNPGTSKWICLWYDLPYDKTFFYFEVPYTNYRLELSR